MLWLPFWDTQNGWIYPHSKTAIPVVKNREQVIAYLESVLTQKTTAEWIAGIVPLKIPVGEINTLDTTLKLKQIQNRNLVQSLQSNAVGKQYKVVKPAIHINGDNPNFATPAPTLSQNATSILQDILKLDTQSIQNLKDNNIIG